MSTSCNFWRALPEHFLKYSIFNKNRIFLIDKGLKMDFYFKMPYIVQDCGKSQVIQQKKLMEHYGKD